MEVVMHEAANGNNNIPNSANQRSDSVYKDTVLPIGKIQANGGAKGDEKLNGIAKDGGSSTSLSEESRFKKLPDEKLIDIQFERVTYTAEVGWKREKKEILHKINGRFPSGKLIAIMGPSGAGKSTLLDVLSGYRIKGVDGSVKTNGLKRNLKSFRKSSCYITQDDRLQPLLTVEENMKLAADLKLATTVSKTEKHEIIEEILENLGLAKHANTRTERLSGGQKKRLSIALELINNPVVMFLDEPTTGLDSSSCSQCVKLLKQLARQGRTIICTIHQPSASLFQVFDLVYVLASGNCLYQGGTDKLVPFLQDVNSPCPMYHNPADFVIELACGEHGHDRIEKMIEATQNGKDLKYFDNLDQLPSIGALLDKASKAMNNSHDKGTTDSLESTSQFNQLKVLLKRGYIKTTRDRTMTYMRIIINILVGFMLGSVYWNAGCDGSKVLDNYNLLFSILMHHMMSTMMLTILTFPSEMTILIKEHFNRWYSLKMYYLSTTLIDIPVSVASCGVFSIIIYYVSGQPLELVRFLMFFSISQMVVFVAQSFGLMIGAVFGVVNGTFVGPTLSVPMMMFAGFGVTLRDLPSYLYWGSYISYLRYGLEGMINAIYGLGRTKLVCPEDAILCIFNDPKKLLDTIAMRSDQYVNDMINLTLILFVFRVVAYVLLRWKLMAVR